MIYQLSQDIYCSTYDCITLSGVNEVVLDGGGHSLLGINEPCVIYVEASTSTVITNINLMGAAINYEFPPGFAFSALHIITDTHINAENYNSGACISVGSSSTSQIEFIVEFNNFSNCIDLAFEGLSIYSLEFNYNQLHNSGFFNVGDASSVQAMGNQLHLMNATSDAAATTNVRFLQFSNNTIIGGAGFLGFNLQFGNITNNTVKCLHILFC